jgi:hypothetical protein
MYPVGPESGIQWTRPLEAMKREGSIQVGRSRDRGKLTKSRWFVVTDSTQSWRIELTSEEADSALQLIKTAAERSAVVSEPTPTYTDTDSVDMPAEVLKAPPCRPIGIFGHVLTQYVVGADGKVEPETIRVLLASDPRLVAVLRSYLLKVVFRPAMIKGKPVRQLVQQGANWSPPPNPRN